jgi:8-oxo-dGTP pyrophosphatase MutT (NUDIX family)
MADPSTEEAMKDTLARAAGVLFLCEGKVLLMQRGAGGDQAGTWAFPGGHIEDGETPAEAAIREVMEETGHDISPADLITWGHRVADGADFQCFMVRSGEAFEVELNDEHGAYMWAAPGALPSNLHPGVPIQLALIDMNELDIARVIRDGELVGPHHYKNVWLFDLRITGTGSAYRSAKRDPKTNKVIREGEYTWRDPSIYLNDDFVERCNGLAVLWEHTSTAMLNTDEYHNRNIGSIMLPYIKGDEVWGVAKIYDEPAALMMSPPRQMSTSPGVILSGGVPGRFETHEDGTKILVESTPSLLDHLAICERGVWDKAESARGVNITGEQIVADESEDPKKIEAEAAEKKAEAKEIEAKDRKDAEEAEKEKAEKDRKDADAGTPLDKVLSHMDSFGKKLDSMGSRLDAMEAKDRKDAEEQPGAAEKLAADKAKKDADEADAKEREEKDRRDSDFKALKDSNDELKKKLDEVEGKIKERPADEEAALADAQARCDSVASKFGERAPPPLAGETGLAYRRRLLGPYVKFSDDWKDHDLSRMDDQMLGVAERQILEAAKREANNPARQEPGKMRMIEDRDGPHIIRTFVGEPKSWMDSIAGHTRQHVTGFNTPNGAN